MTPTLKDQLRSVREALNFALEIAPTAYLREKYAIALSDIIAIEQALPKWQPIDTAPTAGIFMVYSKTKMVYVAVRSSDDYLLRANYPFHTYTNCHPLSENEITHWQPLPAPPVSAEKEGEE